MKNLKHLRDVQEYVEQHGEVLTREIVKEFAVSVPTVHRIFERLSSEGILKRIHGGAVMLTNREESLFEKKLKNKEEQKRAICTYVATHFIEEDSVVGIDSGTTAYHLVEYISAKNISIISSGLRLASHAAQVLPHANVVCSGGTVRSQLSACVGSDAITFFSKRRIHTLILTCSGIELESKSVYEIDSLIAEVKRTMISVSSQVILLFTSDKVNNSSFSYLVDLEHVHHIVCDDGIDPHTKTALTTLNSKLHIAPPI